jgi:hypothetical protein
MVRELPPDDRPPSPGLVPVNDEAGARADAGPISPDNPVAVAGAFLSFLSEPGGPNAENLALVVTPESLPAWGDFTATAEMLRGCGMMSRSKPSDDPAVVYVGYPTDHDGQLYQVQSEMVIPVRAVATLVWRPELESWRVHSVGEYLRPEQVPH